MIPSFGHKLSSTMGNYTNYGCLTILHYIIII